MDRKKEKREEEREKREEEREKETNPTPFIINLE
jgi:hypothetical protein